MGFWCNRTRKQIILRLWQFRNSPRVFASRSILRILLVRLDLFDILEWGEGLIDFLLFENLGRIITKFNFGTDTRKNTRKTRLLPVCFHPFVSFPCRAWGSVLGRGQNMRARCLSQQKMSQNGQKKSTDIVRYKCIECGVNSNARSQTRVWEDAEGFAYI